VHPCRFLSFFLLFIAFHPSLSAQTANTGTVVGLVTDPSGAVIPQAEIRLRDTASQAERTTLV